MSKLQDDSSPEHVEIHKILREAQIGIQGLLNLTETATVKYNSDRPHSIDVVTHTGNLYKLSIRYNGTRADPDRPVICTECGHERWDL